LACFKVFRFNTVKTGKTKEKEGRNGEKMLFFVHLRKMFYT